MQSLTNENKKKTIRNRIVAIVSFLSTAVIICIIVVAIICKKKEDKNEDIILNLTIDPYLVSLTNPETHLLGAQNYEINLTQGTHEQTYDLNATIFYGQSITYAFSLENPSREDIRWNLTIDDFENDGFKIVLVKNDGQEDFSLEDGLERTLNAGSTASFNIVLQIADELQTSGLAKGTFVFSAYLV